jgi:hypothetical protein
MYTTNFPPSHLRNFRHDHTYTVTFQGYYDETRLYKALRPRTESIMHSRTPQGTQLVLVCTLHCRIKRSHVGTIYRNIIACFELGWCVSIWLPILANKRRQSISALFFGKTVIDVHLRDLLGLLGSVSPGNVTATPQTCAGT